MNRAPGLAFGIDHLRWPLATGIVLGAALAVLWAVVWPHGGLGHDAQLYVAQGLHRLNPVFLDSDLFFRFGSQDDFSVFSWVVAAALTRFSVEQTVALLTLLSVAALAAGAWQVAARLGPRPLAWPALAVLLLSPGYYGGYSVFRVVEPFLTARIAGEALVAISLAAWLGGWRRSAFLACAAAFLVHPLMAMPALLLLVLMSLPERWQMPAMLAGAVAAAIGAGFAMSSAGAGWMMDPAWLALLQQRSLHLFPAQWLPGDWNATVLVTLTMLLAWRHAPDFVSKRLALNALLIGWAGLILGLVVSEWLPVELVIKGQPWRWLWLPTLLSALYLPATIAGLSADLGRSGRAAALLLAAAWVGPDTASSALCAGAGLAALAGHRDFHSRAILIGAALAALVVAIWILASVFTAGIDTVSLGRDPMAVERFGNILGVGAPALLAFLLLWLAASRLRLGLALAAAATLALALMFAPRIQANWLQDWYGVEAQDSFSAWRELIPADAEVLWVDRPQAIWLLLQRPSYLSVSQSAGMVFSQPMARLAEQRAANLSPWVSPDYMLGAVGRGKGTDRPLTRPILSAICSDPDLAFVIAAVDLGSAAPAVGWPRLEDLVYLHGCRGFRER